MMKTTTLAKIFNVTPRAITNWKKEKKPVVLLLEKYFTDKDIEEFLNNEQIEKMEAVSRMTTNDIEKFLSNGFLSIGTLRHKLIQMPMVAKHFLIEQLNYCTKNNIAFSLKIAQTVFLDKYNSFVNLTLFDSYKTKYKEFFNLVVSQEEISYINIHKKEIIDLLVAFNGTLENW